jgi:hypothetical protein
MYKPSPHGTSPPAPGPKAECCSEPRCESGLRNNYFEGKRLTADSFRVEQRYLVERRRLLNSAIHGWGVVYGYGVGLEPPDDCPGGRASGRLAIGPGLALDECGRELLQVRELPLGLGDVIVFDEDGARTDRERAFAAHAGPAHPPGGNSRRWCWLLRLHYAEQLSGPFTVDDPCNCERHEHDHTCETVRYSLQPIDCEKCCRDVACELHCDCGRGRCCDQRDDDHDQQRRHAPPPATGLPFERGGCRCLCDHLTRLPRPDCGGGLCEIEDSCGRVRVDLRHGVALACVELVRDDCDRWTFGEEVEACGPRRLVKRNDLLFDLIRGCDLTRISDIGWKDWHRREEAVPFEEFSEALGPDGEKEAEYVTNRFWVRFSRPVRRNTVRPDCFVMTVISVEDEGGWWETRRVPIVRVEFLPPEAGDPGDHVRGARIVVDGAWVEDGVRGRRTLFLDGETRVEIEVRGDFILDCNGQPVDANAVGLSPSPTGNGGPGGTFLSTFRVAAALEAPGHGTRDRRKGASS